MNEKHENIQKLQQMIDEANSIVFFGGAGVSTESGVPDFRSKDGIYSQEANVEEKLSRNYMRRYPNEFWASYRRLFMLNNIKPNAAHYKLAEMEKKGKLAGVITQNIDNLHQEAGSTKLLELHGNGTRFYCESCGKAYSAAKMKKVSGAVYCSKDNCKGLVRPDVVMYGEDLPHDIVNSAVELIRNADLIIIGGTSMNVYPAAGLVSYCSRDCKKVIINMEVTSYDQESDLIIREPIGAVLSQIVV